MGPMRSLYNPELGAEAVGLALQFSGDIKAVAACVLVVDRDGRVHRGCRAVGLDGLDVNRIRDDPPIDGLVAG